MDVCKTDIKNIIQFLRESAVIIDDEAKRRKSTGENGVLRLENRARLMRQTAKKLNYKLNHNNGKESNKQEESRDAEG